MLHRKIIIILIIKKMEEEDFNKNKNKIDEIKERQKTEKEEQNKLLKN